MSGASKGPRGPASHPPWPSALSARGAHPAVVLLENEACALWHRTTQDTHTVLRGGNRGCSLWDSESETPGVEHLESPCWTSVEDGSCVGHRAQASGAQTENWGSPGH